MNNKQNLFNKNRKKTMLITILVAAGLTDLVAAKLFEQIAGYSYDHRADHRAEEHLKKTSATEATYRISSELYHHKLAANSHVDNAYWGDVRYTVNTDSLGFKSKEVVETPLKSDKHRIVFIGDSFTEGVGLEYENTFVGMLAENLSSQNIDVLNAAVGSYSPIIYWRKLKYLIEERSLKFDEAVVYIDISDIEDEGRIFSLSAEETVVSANDDSSRERRQIPRTHQNQENSLRRLRNFVKGNTIILYSVLRFVRDLRINGVGVGEVTVHTTAAARNSRLVIVQPGTEFFTNHRSNRGRINLIRSLWTQDETVFLDYGEKGLAQAAHYMDRLLEVLGKHDILLTIAIYPWPDQIIHNDLDSKQVAFWSRWSKERQVNMLNYFPCFVRADASQEDRQALLEELFGDGDIHWNREGHRLVAKGFVSYQGRPDTPQRPFVPDCER